MWLSDILGRVFTILLCAWLMFLFPLMEVQRQCIQTEKMYLYQETVYFVDGVRNTGEIRHTDRKNYYDKTELAETTEETYHLAYYEFIRVIVLDENGNSVVCYGGSVKAEDSSLEAGKEADNETYGFGNFICSHRTMRVSGYYI